MTKINKEDLPEEVQDYVTAIEEYVDGVDAESAAIKKENADLKSELAILKAAAAEGAVQKASTDDELAEVLKSADPALKAAVLKQQAANRDLMERVAKAEAEKVEATMIAKAASVPHISESTEGLADILKSAYGVSEEYGEKVMALLKAADAQVDAAAAWAEFGRPGGDVTVSGAVEAKAEEVRKADNGISREEAIVKAYDANPDLYDEELKGN